MKASTLVAAASLLLCAQIAGAAEKILDATEAEVSQCTFVQDVGGRSVFGERLKDQGMAKAKEDARASAAKAGATIIVWGKITQTDFTIVEGKAYKCPQ